MAAFVRAGELRKRKRFEQAVRSLVVVLNSQRVNQCLVDKRPDRLGSGIRETGPRSIRLA